MKRDIDLARQLLLDIENESHDCAITRLRKGSLPEAITTESSQRVRYHLRLLIDAGFVKEVDRTADGVPCVRLTNSGHELIELARSDIRWRDAKQYTRETTGGLSLTVIRALLTKWAVEGVAGRRYQAPRRFYASSYPGPYGYRVEPRRHYYSYRDQVDRDATIDAEELQLVRTRPDYRERSDWRERCDVWEEGSSEPLSVTPRYEHACEPAAGEVGVSLPIYLV